MAQRICSVEGCGREVKARDLCDRHYQRWRKYGDALTIGRSGPKPSTDPKPRCSIEGCTRSAQARGWCKTHWAAWKRNGDPIRRKQRVECSIEGCVRPHMARGWCAIHYYRWRRQGDPTKLRGRSEPRRCAITDCDQIAKARGPCAKHYQRMRKAATREHVRAVARAWRAANRDLVIDYAVRHQALKRGSWVEDVERRRVFERDGGICGISGLPVDAQNFHLDHVVPVSRGGEHSYANVQLAHPACNQSKGNRIAA